MQGFNGFPSRGRLIKVPALFFSDLLPQIDSLAELKVTLYCLWRVQYLEGHRVFVRRHEIAADEAFMAGLGTRDDQRRLALDDGLERAVARGSLLHVHVEYNSQEDDLYFVNTERGRAAVRAIEEGSWFPERDGSLPASVTVERPAVFTLYEQNIGALTPLLAENLADLEREYSYEWLADAIEAAVNNNVRKLSYISAILKRWREQGRPAQPRSGDWYISGKYSDEIEY